MSFFVFPSTSTVAISATNNRIALFDVDGTLILSKSGRRFGSDAGDWVFASNNVVSHLNSLNQAGWIVALVSNQSDWTKSEAPKQKLESLLRVFQAANGWAPWCLVGTATIKQKDTLYRKPGRGLYDVLLTQLGITAAAVSELTMCGDAAGAEDVNPAYRWAHSDREFATNIGAVFSRPVDVFPVAPALVASVPSTQELVILVGNPGSGKSTTGRSLAAAGYVHVEQDTLKNKAETLKVAKATLATGKSVVVDATHGSADNRAPYIELAKKLGISCKIMWHVRDGRPFNALREKPVPEVAYAMYSKHFVDPTIGAEVPVTIVY
jgi:bifunctional polynucleotide phosphatase/kinase